MPGPAPITNATCAMTSERIGGMWLRRVMRASCESLKRVLERMTTRISKAAFDPLALAAPQGRQLAPESPPNASDTMADAPAPTRSRLRDASLESPDDAPRVPLEYDDAAAALAEAQAVHAEANEIQGPFAMQRSAL